MLTENQNKYLAKLSSERASKAIIIKPYDSILADIAEKVIIKIKREIPDIDVRFMGASALKISGQNDIDIYIMCKNDELKEIYLSKLKLIFGEQIKNKWHWYENEIEISVYLSNPENQNMKEQLEIFDILNTSPELLKEYELLKSSLNGKPYNEYQTAKYKFYNRVLGVGL